MVLVGRQHPLRATVAPSFSTQGGTDQMIHGPLTSTPRLRRGRVQADSVRAAYRGLRAIGLSESEAGNLSAHLAGLGHVPQGWLIREIERLLFIRSLVDSGRIDR